MIALAHQVSIFPPIGIEEPYYGNSCYHTYQSLDVHNGIIDIIKWGPSMISILNHSQNGVWSM